MSLYNLKTNPAEGLPFIITKFTSDLDVESSYPTGTSICECPAGHRPFCRHRQMLPNLRQRVDTAWFWDFEGEAWVDPTGEANKPALESEAEVRSSSASAEAPVSLTPQAGSQASAPPASAFKRRI